jgi:hypothetical protein
MIRGAELRRLTPLLPPYETVMEELRVLLAEWLETGSQPKQ